MRAKIRLSDKISLQTEFSNTNSSYTEMNTQRGYGKCELLSVQTS